MGEFPVQGVLPKCLKGFILSEVNSDAEQAREPKLPLCNFLHAHITLYSLCRTLDGHVICSEHVLIFKR
jgi:hypothetical protein